MSSTNWNTIISSYYICFNPYNFNTFSVIRLPSKVKSFILFIFTFNQTAHFFTTLQPLETHILIAMKYMFEHETQLAVEGKNIHQK